MTENVPPPAPAEIAALFSRQSVWQSWLDVESALAATQAELGMIPAEAAREIAARARLETIGEAGLAADIAKTRAPVVSLVRLLSRACAGEAGGFVHWGATTQNVVQTGRVLLMRRAHAALMRRLAAILDRLAGFAEAEAGTVTVARTNIRHALPITFGFKAGGWIEEFLRHEERFREAAPRVFRAQWGGAVGAMHAVGEAGPELNRRLAARLGLGWHEIPSRAGLDTFAEYVLLLGMFAATCGKIARDLYVMMSDEFGEVIEDLGEEVIGSSTMPHKVNSKIAVHVIALSARVRAQVPLALEAMQPSFEGDGANNQMLSALIDQACPLAYELAAQMDELLAAIRLRPAAIGRNLAMSGAFMASENAMMALAPLLGRTVAHDIVHHAIAEAVETGGDLATLIAAAPDAAGRFDAAMVRDALDPSSYIGQSVALARGMVGPARAAAARLRDRANGSASTGPLA